METNVNYTIVGIFVIGLISATIFGIIWLSAGLTIDSNTIYKVYMKESVSGLNADAPVEYNGVNVGSVKSIWIDHKDPQIVELLLNIKSSTPITAGTKAMMNTRGLTGIAFIALQDKGTDRRPLHLLPGEDHIVIQTAPSLFMRIDTALSKFNESVHQISTSVQSLLNEQNLRSIKETLENLRMVTQQLSPLVQNSKDLVQSSHAAINIFSTQTLPAANQMMSNLDTIISNLSTITTEMKQNPAILIRGKQPQPLGPGEK